MVNQLQMEPEAQRPGRAEPQRGGLGGTDTGQGTEETPWPELGTW